MLWGISLLFTFRELFSCHAVDNQFAGNFFRELFSSHAVGNQVAVNYFRELFSCLAVEIQFDVYL